LAKSRVFRLAKGRAEENTQRVPAGEKGKEEKGEEEFAFLCDFTKSRRGSCTRGAKNIPALSRLLKESHERSSSAEQREFREKRGEET